MGITNLETHRGLTKQLRIQAAVPSSPTPTAGDVYLDNTAGAEALGIKTESTWIYVSLQT
jgi:hypothetical protein